MVFNSSQIELRSRGRNTEEAQVRGFRLGLLIAVAVSVLVPAVGQAAYTSSSLSTTASRETRTSPSPPPQPDLPPEVRSQVGRGDRERRLRSRSARPAKCRSRPGSARIQKRLPTAPALSDGRPRPAGRGAGRRFAGRPEAWKAGRGDGVVAERNRRLLVLVVRSATSNYLASKGVNSLFAVQTNEQPYIPTGENELEPTARLRSGRSSEGGAGCFSTAETGWSESIGQFKDVEPASLRVFDRLRRWRGYSSNAYGGHYWVQSSGVMFPNQALTHNDVFHVYGARMDRQQLVDLLRRPVGRIHPTLAMDLRLSRT